MTITYDVAIGGGTTATLSPGTGVIRYGIELAGVGGLLVGTNIATFTASLKKNGTPSGNITAVVRNSSDTVVATSVEAYDASTLSTSFAGVLFTFASPPTLANGDKILIEYGGTTSIDIEVYTTDQFNGATTRRTRYISPSYATSNIQDIAGKITDGVFISQTYTHKYNIRQLATQTFTHIYKIRQLATQTFTHKYNIRQLVSQTFTHLYNILPPAAVVVVPGSFSSLSFSNISFTIAPRVSTGGGGTTTGKKNKFRNWIKGLARGLRDFFKIKQREEEPEPEEVEIPPAQPPQTVTILSSPPTMETVQKLETLNDKWSVVASVGGGAVTSAEPIDQPEDGILSPSPPVYPRILILNPLTAPLIQTKVTLPRATRSTSLPPYRVAEGSHIESQMVGFKKPKNRSKAAATLNTLMLLLEIERQV